MTILLAGCSGRMGTAVAELAAERGVAVACGVDPVKRSAPFPVYADFSAVTESFDAVVDFSAPAALGGCLRLATERGVPAVLAATGYSDDDRAAMRLAAERIPVFHTGNLSVGVSLMRELVKRAAAVLGDFDIEIVERHHRNKKDAPSGTALMLAESAEEGRGTRMTLRFGRSGTTGVRGRDEIGVHSVRGGTTVGEHEVCFSGEDETLTIVHGAYDRRVFAAGALRAAAWLVGRPAGLYDMDDLLSQPN